MENELSKIAKTDDWPDDNHTPVGCLRWPADYTCTGLADIDTCTAYGHSDASVIDRHTRSNRYSCTIESYPGAANSNAHTSPANAYAHTST